MPILYIMLKTNKSVSIKITKEELKKLALVATIGYVGTGMLLFLSYNYVPTGMATTIHFIYPILVITGCVVFYKERIN